MVDLFAIGLTHALIALAVWRLVQRADLDEDPEIAADEPGLEVKPQLEVRRNA